MKKIKNKNFLYSLLASSYLLFISGCGKKEPIGYDIIQLREGEIKVAKVKIAPLMGVHSEFATPKKSPYLFAGREAGFDAIAFIYFKFDSFKTPESLWVVGRTSGILQMYKIMDSLDMDSVNWSSRPELQYFSNFEVGEAETSVVYMKEWGADTLFYIAFGDTSSLTTGMVSFDPLWIKLENDTFPYRPMKRIYIDTSYFSRDSIPDSLIYIETGAFVTQCTLYMKLYLIDSVSSDFTDTAWIQIDYLTDSLRKIYALDRATINRAEFQILIDTSYSYRSKGIEILAQYEIEDEKTFSPVSKVTEDSLTLFINSLVEKWFKKGDKLWVVIRGMTEEISRVVLIPSSARVFIVYTLPPRGRG